MTENVNSVLDNIVNLFTVMGEKGWKVFLYIGACFISLITPAIPVIITVFTFIITDAIYGYKVSRKYGHKEIESNKLWKTVHKFTEVFTLIVLALLIDKFILLTYDSLTSVKVVAGCVCASEGLSLLESFRALYPQALMSKILSKIIKSKAEKYLDIDLSDILDLTDNENNIKNNKNKQ